MRAGFRVLVLSAWLGTAGVAAAFAQADPGSGGVVLDGCGASCRLLHSMTARSPAAEAPAAQPDQIEPDRDSQRPRRSPRNPQGEARPATDAAEERRPARRPVDAAQPSTSPRRTPAPEIEQTASVGQAPVEIGFVARPDDTHGAVAGDLAAALAPDVTLRTIPGRGGPLRDVLSLPGADVTILSSLSLARGAAGSDRFVYIAKLFTEELHALAAPGIARLEDLAGKAVYLGGPDSDAALAAETFLETRGIRVVPAAGSRAEVLAKLRDGRIAAAFILAPKPLAALSDLRGLRLLPLPYRSSDTDFHPAAFTAADYPGLVSEGRRVETVALEAVLVAPRWRDGTPRQDELAAFATRLFERFATLDAAGRHPKWRETNLAAMVDGQPRLKVAQQWVAARLKSRESSAALSAPGAAR